MEKLIYVFWRRDGRNANQGANPNANQSANQDVNVLREALLSDVSARLRALGVSRLQVNVADLGKLEAGLPRMGRTDPLPDGFVSFWVTSAFRRAPAEQVLMEACGRVAGYSVVESTILTNRKHPAKPGERTWGFSQVALLHVPGHMTFEQWRDVWLNHHTPIAIETQANFRYVQNVVLQALTDGAPPWRGIVEECFPLEALSDPHWFFDAVGDDAKLQSNLSRMMDSVYRFLEQDGTDLIRTSEYQLDAAAEPGL